MREVSHTFPHSSLDVYGPLYVGGVETHVPALSLSGTTYHGCIANLTIDHTLLDLSVPVRTHGTRKGCPPRDVSCEDVICVSGECVEVWNGTVCSCEGVSPSCTVGEIVRRQIKKDAHMYPCRALMVVHLVVSG